MNILNNIKTEKLTDDEKCHKMGDEEFSPRRQQAKRQEIINVKELQVSCPVLADLSSPSWIGAL